MSHVAPGGSACSEATYGLDISRAVTIVVGARPTLATDGSPLTGWIDSGAAPAVAVLFLDGTVACTVGAPATGTNGVELYGYSSLRARWCWIPYLHNAADIPIFSAFQSWCGEVDKLGIYSRIAVAGIATAGVVTATLIPLARS